MKNNSQKLTHSVKTKLKKLPQLTQLNFEELSGVVGGFSQSTAEATAE